MILLAAFLIALVLWALAYPFLRWSESRRSRRGEPTWMALKLASGDREAALEHDRRRQEKRARRRGERRSGGIT